MFGRETIATDVVFSQDIHHLESINHMSWLPVEKLTTEERDIIQDFNKRKTSLLGRYHQQIKDLIQLMRLGLETLVVNIKRNYKGVKSCIKLNNIR